MVPIKQVIENYSQISILYSQALIMPSSDEREAILSTLDSHFDAILNNLLPHLQQAVKAGNLHLTVPKRFDNIG
jgi:tripartite-type tricarboxylate transporter receptor subunit TctC